MLGGPLGAVAGLALGAMFDSAGSGVKGQLNRQEQSQFIFFVATFSLLGKLARADGMVSKEEIIVIDRFMKESLRLDPEGRKYAINIFNQAKTSPDNFEDYALQFYRIFQDRREIRLSMLELLVKVAAADGVIHPEEEKMIASAARIFRINQSEYHRLRKIFIGDIDKYYSVLECSRNDSVEEIKRKYRKLATDYHPDKIISKGLPEEFITFANKKFQEIQEAYEKIKKDRNFN